MTEEMETTRLIVRLEDVLNLFAMVPEEWAENQASTAAIFMVGAVAVLKDMGADDATIRKAFDDLIPGGEKVVKAIVGMEARARGRLQ